jgi:hypothetical protein
MSVGSAEPAQVTVNSSGKAVASSVGTAVDVGITGVSVTASFIAGVAVANETVEVGCSIASGAVAGEVAVSDAGEALQAARRIQVKQTIETIMRFISHFSDLVFNIV